MDMKATTSKGKRVTKAWLLAENARLMDEVLRLRALNPAHKGWMIVSCYGGGGGNGSKTVNDANSNDGLRPALGWQWFPPPPQDEFPTLAVTVGK